MRQKNKIKKYDPKFMLMIKIMLVLSICENKKKSTRELIKKSKVSTSTFYTVIKFLEKYKFVDHLDFNDIPKDIKRVRGKGYIKTYILTPLGKMFLNFLENSFKELTDEIRESFDAEVLL